MNATRSLVAFLVYAAITGVVAAQRPTSAEAEPAQIQTVQAAPLAPAVAAPAAIAPAEKKEGAKNSAALLAKSVAPPPLSPRFQQVRARIEALFLHRNETPPAVDSRFNPFRGSVGAIAGGATSPGAPGVVSGPPPAPVNPEMQLLQQAASALKVAGVIQINNRDHLIINQAPYKEGDVIIGRAKGQPIYLRLKAISRFTFTLTYNESELAVKY